MDFVYKRHPSPHLPSQQLLARPPLHCHSPSPHSEFLLVFLLVSIHHHVAHRPRVVRPRSPHTRSRTTQLRCPRRHTRLHTPATYPPLTTACPPMPVSSSSNNSSNPWRPPGRRACTRPNLSARRSTLRVSRSTSSRRSSSNARHQTSKTSSRKRMGRGPARPRSLPGSEAHWSVIVEREPPRPRSVRSFARLGHILFPTHLSCHDTFTNCIPLGE